MQAPTIKVQSHTGPHPKKLNNQIKNVIYKKVRLLLT